MASDNIYRNKFYFLKNEPIPNIIRTAFLVKDDGEIIYRGWMIFDWFYIGVVILENGNVDIIWRYGMKRL